MRFNFQVPFNFEISINEEGAAKMLGTNAKQCDALNLFS